MVNTALSPNATLADALAARARAATDGRLVFDVAAGLVVALGIAIWHPRAWVIPFNAAICLAAFGAWGIAEREITERSNATGNTLVRALRVLRWVSVVAGALAVAVAAFAVLGMVLGTWIS